MTSNRMHMVGFQGQGVRITSVFAPKNTDGNSFADDADTSILAVKAKAAKVDLISDTNLSQTVAETEKKYSKLTTEHLALQTELQAEVDSFLGLDIKFLKNQAIPFVSRIGFIKNAANKILGVMEKVQPVLNGINSVKDVLQSVAGDSLVEADVPAAARQDHSDVVSALKNVEVKVNDAEADLKEAKKDAHYLKSLTEGDINEDSFNWGGLFSTVVKVGTTVAKTLLA